MKLSEKYVGEVLNMYELEDIEEGKGIMIRFPQGSSVSYIEITKEKNGYAIYGEDNQFGVFVDTQICD